MRFAFDVGIRETTHVEFYHNPRLGSVTIIANGKPVVRQWPWHPHSLINIPIVRKYEFTVGIEESHAVKIEIQRERWAAALRPHKFRVYVDGELVEEHSGI